MALSSSNRDLPWKAHILAFRKRPCGIEEIGKAQLVPKTQLGRFWIFITFISILCISLQILGNFQQISCKQEIKHLILQQNINLPQTSQVQKNCNSTLSLHPLNRVPISHTETIPTQVSLQRMKQNKTLNPTLQMQNDLSYSEENALVDLWWLSSSSKHPKPSLWGSKKVAKAKDWTPPQIKSSKPLPKAAQMMNRKRELGKKIEMVVSPASRSFDSVGGSQQNHPQSTIPKYGRGQSQGKIMKDSLFRQKIPLKDPITRSRTSLTPFLDPGLPDGLASSHKAACTSKTHIFFLKVHKSASSTIMNILFRFGEQRNLTFALPTNQNSQLFYPFYFVAEVVEGFTDGTSPSFDIMCHHLRFLQTEVQRVMPNDTFYFSIMRNPIHLMESSFSYFKGSSSFFNAKSLDDFLNNTSKFYDPLKTDSHYSRNLMAFDFGFNHNSKASAQHTQLLTRVIERQFDLILIAEYFDESMVLLKDALCWSLDDVVSFPINQQDTSYRSTLSPRTIQKIKSWNKLDWELYLHFNRTFWERINQSMSREYLQQEVTALRKRRKQLAKICLQREQSVHSWDIEDKLLKPFQYGRTRILGYNLRHGLDETTKQACRSFIMPELQYSKRLYERQFPQKALWLSQTKKHSKTHSKKKERPLKSHS